MKYRLIGDSCSDLDAGRKADPHYTIVPLSLQIENYQILDDASFNQKDFLKRVKRSNASSKTACPSPQDFKNAYECEEDNIFVLTLSEHLSGTYQSAVIGKQLFEEEHGDSAKNIFVLSSHGASATQLRIFIELERLINQGFDFNKICEEITKFRDRAKTYFVLEDLETLRKNGRLSGLSAFFATKLNIKPVMGAENGRIVKLDQARGINKALAKLVEIAQKDAKLFEGEKTVVITHVNNPERIEYVAELFRNTGKFKDIITSEAAGVTTVYACDGGIVVGLG